MVSVFCIESFTYLYSFAKDIMFIKNYLYEKNLIKRGSEAPNDILRKMYEDSILSGNISNSNSDNLVFNYLSI